jgi:hypothetical protein
MRYKLDASTVVELDGNTTITGLSPGTHRLTVYATDAAGNTGASETLYFSIAESFPTTLVIVASGALAIAVAAGLVVYFKKFKARQQPAQAT